jgi:MFS family permease
MIAPAAPQVAAKLNITDEVRRFPPSHPSLVLTPARLQVIEAMSVSVFVLAFAFSPLIFGPLSELCGRVRVLQFAGIGYAIFNLVCGFATTKGQFIAFRFLAGFGGGAPLSIGAGVLSDMWRAEERGKASALYSLGPLLGPAMGCVSLPSIDTGTANSYSSFPQTGYGRMDR